MAITELYGASLTFSSTDGTTHTGGQGAPDTPDTFWDTAGSTWVWQHDGTPGGTSGAVNMAAHSGAMHSSNGGDYMTCVIPLGTKAVYLLGEASHSNCDLEIWLSTDAGATYTIDYGRLTSMVSLTSVGAQLYRYPHVILRGLDPTVHYGVKLVVITGQSGVYINSIICVDNVPYVPTPNKYVALGDSWTAGAGASSTNIKGYAYQFAQMLRDQLKVHTTRGPAGMGSGGFTFVNLGVSGDAIFGLGNASSGKIGGFTRLWDPTSYTGVVAQAQGGVFPNLGDWLSILYGPNDLGVNGVAAGEHARNLYTCLCFIEDAVDTTQMAGVLVGTPGYVSPELHVQYQHGMEWDAVTWFGDLSSNYEAAVDAVYDACAPFPWVTVVPVYEHMDEKSDLVWPNINAGYNGDWGLHPGDQGHMVIADAFLGSAKGILQSAITQGGRVLSAR